MNEHTKLPWNVYQQMVELATDSDTECHEIIRSDGKGQHWIAKVLNAEDAEFIVRACNAHDALVEALDDCIDSLEYVNNNHPDTTGYGVRYERIQKAAAALALARREAVPHE